MAARLSVVATTPSRAILYLRQSISREDSISIELQETACRDHASRLGYVVVAVESDPGISGRTWERPAVQRVMSMIAARDADVVVVWKWSRLSRSRRDWHVAVDKIESVGGRVESATEPVDATTATGRFTRGMLAEMAAFESDRIGEVWKEIHQRRLNQGLPGNGGQRFGYRLQDGYYLPDTTTSPYLGEAYRRYISGHNLSSIARWLNNSGLSSPRDQEWRASNIGRTLDTGFAAGLLVRGSRTFRVEDFEWIAGSHPAIISSDEWQNYLHLRLQLRISRPRAPRRSYTLSGLVRCGSCNLTMHAVIDPNRPANPLRWACQNGRHLSVSNRPVEDFIKFWLDDVAAGIDKSADELRRKRVKGVLRKSEASEAAREIVRLEARMQRLVSGWLDGQVPQTAYETERNGITRAIELAQQQLTLVAETQRRASDSPMRDAKGLLAEWETLLLEDRQRILQSLIEHVLVFPDQEFALVTHVVGSHSTLPNGGTYYAKDAWNANDGSAAGYYAVIADGYYASVKDAPPAGYTDNGSAYTKTDQVKDVPPTGYSDDGTQWVMTAAKIAQQVPA